MSRGCLEFVCWLIRLEPAGAWPRATQMKFIVYFSLRPNGIHFISKYFLNCFLFSFSFFLARPLSLSLHFIDTNEQWEYEKKTKIQQTNKLKSYIFHLYVCVIFALHPLRCLSATIGHGMIPQPLCLYATNFLHETMAVKRSCQAI